MTPEAQQRFTSVYRAEFPYVWKSLGRLGAREREREDLAHDVFTTAFRHWDAYDAARPVRPWLFGIAYRVLLDFRRKRQNQMEDVMERVELADAARSADDALAAQQAWALAARALDALELDRRAVFVMHEIDERPIPEVAQELGIPLNTAYSRLRLARRDFNQKVAEYQTGRMAP